MNYQLIERYEGHSFWILVFGLFSFGLLTNLINLNNVGSGYFIAGVMFLVCYKWNKIRGGEKIKW